MTKRRRREPALTTLGLDDDGMTALKNVILNASIAADDLIAEGKHEAGRAAHEDIALLCELLGTTLEALWAELEAEVNDPLVAGLVSFYPGFGT